MTIPIEKTITDNGNTELGIVPPGKQGVTVKLSGTISGTMTLGYKGGGSVLSYNSTDASKTAAGEISSFAGAGDTVYLRVSGATNPGILAVVTFW